MHILPLSAQEIEKRLIKLPEHVADQEYNPMSEYAQSGKAVAEALEDTLSKVTELMPEPDASLTVAGAYADAQAVGGKINEIHQIIDQLQDVESGLTSSDDGLGNVTLTAVYVPMMVTDDGLGNVSITM
jgi:hypothetical protein